MTEEAKGARLAQAIRALVEQALQRRRQTQQPRFEGHELVVGHGAAEARADIAGTLSQWAELPDDLRDKRIEQIAELLSAAPLVLPGTPRTPPRRSAGWSSVFAPLLVVVVTAGVLAVAYRYLAPHGASLLNFASGERARPEASAAPAASDPDRERAALAGSACEQSSARVARGANIGPADVEGWVVELVLLRRAGGAALVSSPALNQFLTKRPDSAAPTSFVSWSGARSLLAAKRFDAEVSVRPVSDLGSEHLAGVSLEFSGPYVVPYFTEAERADYFMLADALSEALQSTDGALFAHCAGAGGHHIGTWFLGATPGAAMASLVYYMAFFSETPVLKSGLLGVGNAPAQRGRAFDSISKAAAGLDRSSAAALIGAELGMISGRPKQPTRLTFPFRDANRATRASLAAARALQLAER